eukprot:c696_g1_i2.p1 GENE.c696_g1_i2~~c696_g1_i2.p1  ORF type:complete len:307 (+),score=50.42 c696_g1_i2:52-921(+)
MDHMLEIVDEQLLDGLYTGLGNQLAAIGISSCDVAPYLLRTSLVRQAWSLFWLVAFGGVALYLAAATFSYFFIFDKKRVMSDSKYLPSQIQKELWLSIPSIFGMSLITLPIFLLDVNGYAKFYRNVSDQSWGWDHGWGYLAFSVVRFLLFTDGLIYCIHRILHWSIFYKYIHKPHHRWIVCTPFASHAFHPVDGVAQSLPYHMYAFIFPMHSVLWVVMFTVVNCWTVSIHDGNHFSNSTFINTEAHHDIHHREFNYNLGQFTTIFDRLGGTYKRPYHLVEADAKQKKEL